MLLKLAGADVLFIARGAHLEAIRKNSVRLQIGKAGRSWRRRRRPRTRRNSDRKIT